MSLDENCRELVLVAFALCARGAKRIATHQLKAPLYPLGAWLDRKRTEQASMLVDGCRFTEKGVSSDRQLSVEVDFGQIGSYAVDMLESVAVGCRTPRQVQFQAFWLRTLTPPRSRCNSVPEECFEVRHS